MQFVFWQEVVVSCVDVYLGSDGGCGVWVVVGEYQGFYVQCVQFVDCFVVVVFDFVGDGEQGLYVLWIVQCDDCFVLVFQGVQVFFQGW